MILFWRRPTLSPSWRVRRALDACWSLAFSWRAPWVTLGPRLSGQSDLLGAWGLRLSVGPLTQLPPTQLAGGGVGWWGLPPSSRHPHRLPMAWHLHGALARPRTAHGHILGFQLTSEQEAGSTWREASYCLPGRAVLRSCGQVGGVGLLQKRIIKRGSGGSRPPVPGGGRRFRPPRLVSQGSSVAEGGRGGGRRGSQGPEPPRGPQRLSWCPADGPQTGPALGVPWGRRTQAGRIGRLQASSGRPP